MQPGTEKWGKLIFGSQKRMSINDAKINFPLFFYSTPMIAGWLAERLHAPRAWPLLSAVKQFVFDSQIKTYIHFADFSRHVLIPNLTSGRTKSLYYRRNEMNSVFFFFIITIMGCFFSMFHQEQTTGCNSNVFFSLKSFRNFF